MRGTRNKAFCTLIKFFLMFTKIVLQISSLMLESRNRQFLIKNLQAKITANLGDLMTLLKQTWVRKRASKRNYTCEKIWISLYV